LYCTSYDISGTLLQYNISLSTLPLILASRTPLSATSDLYGLQVARDGKIYVAESFSTPYVGVVNSPNVQGSGCNFIENGVNLDTAFMGNSCRLGLPGFMQTYLKIAMDVICTSTAAIENNLLDEVGIYPNPSADEFYLNLGELPQIEISIIDNTGRRVKATIVGSDEHKFGHDLIPGIYFITLRIGYQARTIKLVKL